MDFIFLCYLITSELDIGSMQKKLSLPTNNSVLIWIVTEWQSCKLISSIKIEGCHLLVRLTICWLYALEKDMTPSKIWCLAYDIKLHLVGRLKNVEHPSLALFPGSLWPGVVVSVNILSMSQIDLFEYRVAHDCHYSKVHSDLEWLYLLVFYLWIK